MPMAGKLILSDFAVELCFAVVVDGNSRTKDAEVNTHGLAIGTGSAQIS